MIKVTATGCNLFQHTYLLSRDEMQSCFAHGKRIGDDEKYGNILSIKIGDENIVGLYIRVIGDGSLADPFPRRVDVVAQVFSGGKEHWQILASAAAVFSGSTSNCIVYIDRQNGGDVFAKMVESHGLAYRVEVISGGMPCFKKEYRDRFHNLRAQCSVHAAEAVKNKHVGVLDHDSLMNSILLEQSSRIPFFFNERAKYNMVSRHDMDKQGMKSTEVWDALSNAFTEGVSYVPAKKKKNKTLDQAIKDGQKSREFFHYYAPFTLNTIALALFAYSVWHSASERHVIATIASSVILMLCLYMTICDVVATRRSLRRMRFLSR